MEYKVQRLPLTKLALNTGQIEGLGANPRQWTAEDVKRMARSLTETPELYEMRPIIAVPHGKTHVILAGSLRFCGAKERGDKDAPVITVPEDTPVRKLQEIILKDNGSFGAWDMDALANEWDDLPLTEWGVPAWDTDEDVNLDREETPEEEIARKEQEFKDRMAAGEISEEDEEYQEFLEKFKLKKTTDDCYTPTLVYDAIAEWVANEYKVERARFVRPFYPGGDYKNEKYKDGDIVVDNPPFSIWAEIIRFYKDRGIHFFLFGPHLTIFSSVSSLCTTLVTGSAITYENGAQVNTSFATDLEDASIRFRSCPSLYSAIKKANDENLRQSRKELPKYSYDHHVITSPFIGALSRLGIEFSVPVAESVSISRLDSQKGSGKAIFGKGYLVSDRVYAEREKAERVYAEREKAEREKAEREKAEREKAEREKAERWELSERELAMVAKLSR